MKINQLSANQNYLIPLCYESKYKISNISKIWLSLSRLAEINFLIVLNGKLKVRRQTHAQIIR